MTLQRLGLLVPSLAGGGAERVMVNLASGFAERGLSVDLLVGDPEGPYRSHVPDGVRLVDLGASRVRYMVVPLARYLLSEEVDVLLSATDPTNVAALSARGLFAPRTPVVISVHISVSQLVRHSSQVRVRWLPHLLRRLYRRADAIVAVSAGAASDLADTAGVPLREIHVVHNPVVTRDLIELARAPVHHPWLQSNEVPVIMGVGRLAPQKDFGTLIRAFGKVRGDKTVRLMILGEGEQRFQLEALIRQLGLQDAVSMPGFVENPYAYMARAQLLVLSSRWEGFGNVIAEAMAVGTPVVSTDCKSGPSEILDHGRFGRLVPVADESAIAAAIVATLEEPPDAGLLKRRAAKFTVESSVDRYLELMQSVCVQ